MEIVALGVVFVTSPAVHCPTKSRSLSPRWRAPPWPIASSRWPSASRSQRQRPRITSHCSLTSWTQRHQSPAVSALLSWSVKDQTADAAFMAFVWCFVPFSDMGPSDPDAGCWTSVGQVLERVRMAVHLPLLRGITWHRRYAATGWVSPSASLPQSNFGFIMTEDESG